MAKPLDLAIPNDWVLEAWALLSHLEGSRGVVFEEGGEDTGAPTFVFLADDDEFHFVGREPVASANVELLTSAAGAASAAPGSGEPALIVPDIAAAIFGDPLIFEPSALAETKADSGALLGLTETASLHSVVGDVVVAPSFFDALGDLSLQATVEATPPQGASTGPFAGWIFERDGTARFVEDIIAERAQNQVPLDQQYSMLDPLL